MKASGQLAVQIPGRPGAAKVVAPVAAPRRCGSRWPTRSPVCRGRGGPNDCFAAAFDKGADVVLDYLWGRRAKRLLIAAAKAGRAQPDKKAGTKSGGAHPRPAQSSGRSPGRQSEPQALAAQGARLGLSARFAQGGRRDRAGVDLSRGLPVDDRAGFGRCVLAGVIVSSLIE